MLRSINLGADLLDPQSWNAYAYVRNNPLALVDPMGLCTFDAEGNAVEDENGACYEGGFGGSVTVTAQAPPDVMPIFVSLPSLLSDTQQPMQTAPPAVTEVGMGVRPPNNGNPANPNKQRNCLIEAAKDKALSIGLDVIGAIPGVGNAASASAAVVRGAIAIDHVITRPAVALASGAYGAYGAISAGAENPTDSLVGAASAGTGIGLTLADISLGGTKAIPLVGNFLSVATLGWDAYQAYKTYQACMAKPE